jgi:hypothetical protein
MTTSLHTMLGRNDATATAGASLGDRNFPYTEDQYIQKLGTVCQMLNQVSGVLPSSRVRCCGAHCAYL